MKSNTTSTKGGSVTGLTVCCAVSGYPDLNWIEPETLHLKVGCEAVVGHLLPDGLLPVHAGGRIYLMPQDQWTRYKALCASAAAMAAAMRG